MNHFDLFVSCMLDLSALELLEEILTAAIMWALWVEHLLHNLLNHLVLLPDEPLLTQELGSQLLVIPCHIIQLFFQIDLLLV